MVRAPKLHVMYTLLYVHSTVTPLLRIKRLLQEVWREIILSSRGQCMNVAGRLPVSFLMSVWRLKLTFCIRAFFLLIVHTGNQQNESSSEYSNCFVSIHFSVTFSQWGKCVLTILRGGEVAYFHTLVKSPEAMHDCLQGVTGKKKKRNHRRLGSWLPHNETPQMFRWEQTESKWWGSKERLIFQSVWWKPTAFSRPWSHLLVLLNNITYSHWKPTMPIYSVSALSCNWAHLV